MEWSQLGQVGFAFVCVIGLMLGMGFVLKRFGLEKRWQLFRSANGLITVQDTMFLDPKRRVMLLGCEQKRYIVLLDGEKAVVIDQWEEQRADNGKAE